MTTIVRSGPGGVTIEITETADGWIISYQPATRYGPPAFTESSQTARIPDDFGDVLAWAKRRWDEYLHAQQAA